MDEYLWPARNVAEYAYCPRLFYLMEVEGLHVANVETESGVAGHFQRTAAGCMMTDAGRKAFFGAWGRRMDTEVTHPVFNYRLSYRRMLTLHARMIAAWMLGEVATLSFLTTR